MTVRHAAGVVVAISLAFAGPALAVAPPIPVPAPGCAVASDGRVSLLRGEGSAEDSIGTSDGTLVGATAAYEAGVAGQALSLPGDADHVELPNAPEFDITGDLTLDAWVLLDNTTFGMPGPNGIGGDRVIFWNSNAAETPVFALWIEGDGTTSADAPLRFFATPATDDPAFVDSQSLGWESNRWYHVAVTRSAGVVSFYRDGAPAGSATLAAPHAPDGDLPLGIGAAPISGEAFNPIKGAIDEPAIWRRMLSAGEVAALHAAGTNGCGPSVLPVANLLAARDGDAEAGRATVSDAATVPPPPGYWTAGGAISQVRYAPGPTQAGGFPGADVMASIAGGDAFLAGGPTVAAQSVMTSQDIDLGWARNVVDAGLLSATMSAALGGRGSEEDRAQVTFEYRNAAGLLSSTVLGPVTAEQREGETTLLARSATADVPLATTFVRVIVTFLGDGDGYADGYVDNVRLALAQKPGNPPPAAPPAPPPAGPGLPPTTGPVIRPSRPLPLTVAPRSLSLSVTPARDRLRPFTFTARGKLGLPAGVSAASGCDGSIRVRIKRRTTTLKTRTVSLKSDCTYSSRSTDSRSGVLKFDARFSGNAALLAKSSVTRTVRAG